MEQPEYNMFQRERFEREYLSLYAEFGLGTTIWSPLASGVLSGKYNDGIPEDGRLKLKGYEWLLERYETEEGRQRIEKVRRLSPIAQELGCSMAQLALAWCLKNPNVSSVITGASKPQQVTENMGALTVMDHLTPAMLERIEQILDNRPEPAPNFR
jgi:aryl-alcohol dehydrogenase-like predicted oxidoreductase